MGFDWHKPKNWYKERALTELNFLSIFINDIEIQCKDSIEKFFKERQTEIIDENEAENDVTLISYYKGLDDHSWDLNGIFMDYFPNLLRGSALITLFGFFENELDRLCYEFIRTEKYKIQLNDFKGQGIERSSNYLKKIAALDINTNANSIWIKIKNIQEVRNRFTHHRGHLNTQDMFRDLDDDWLFDTSKIDNSPRKNDIYFLKDELCLELVYNLIQIKENYLKEVVTTFADFYKLIDKEIQKKYQ